MATLRQVIDTTAELAGLTYPEVADWLNDAPPVDNPTPRGETPRHITLKRVMQILPAAEMAKAYQLAGFVADVKTAIDADDREYMAVLIGIAVAAGAVTQATAGALAAELAATEPDPDWAAQIPGAPRWQAAGLPGPVTAADVQGAIHANPE